MKERARGGPPESPGPAGGGALPLVIASMAAGFATAGLDLLHLLVRGELLSGWRDPVLQALGSGVLAGFFCGAAAALVLVPLRRISRPHAFLDPAAWLLWLALAGTFVLLNRPLFEGPTIRDHPQRTLIESGIDVTAAVVLLSLILFLRRELPRLARAGLRRRRLLFSLGGVLAGSLLHLADALLWPGLYGIVHAQLTLAAGVCLALAALPWARRSPALLRVVLLVVLALPSAHVITTHERAEGAAARALLAERGVALPRLLLLSEAPFRLFAEDRRRPIGAEARAVLEVRRGTRALRSRVAAILDRRVPGRRKLNLLILSLDSVRDDHVHHKGYDRPTTPHLDRFARESMVAERCYTTYPSSAYAYSSLFSGRFAGSSPLRMIRRDALVRIPDDLILPGLLASRGWRTIAETGFRRRGLLRRDVFGHLEQGFEIFSPGARALPRNAREVSAELVRHLERTGETRFFIWGHFLDAHHPYIRHPEHDFGAGDLDRYDSEIAFADAALGRVLTALLEAGRSRDTVVVVMSDHGQEFMEHGKRFHDSNLHDTQVRVPLLIRVPGLPAALIEGPVSLADVLPTLLELLDIPDPWPRNGVSLWPRILGLRRGCSLAFGQLFPTPVTPDGRQDMLVLGGRKLILDLVRGTRRVFDLVADPAERTDLSPCLPRKEMDLLRDLHQALSEEIRNLGRIPEAGSLGPPGREEIPRLLSSLRKAPPVVRREKAETLAGRLMRPAPEFWQRHRLFLEDDLRRRLAAFVLDLSERSDDEAFAASCLALLAGLDPHERDFLKPAAERPDRMPLLLRELLLRAHLGDEGVAPLLALTLKMVGVPEKHRLAAALMLLGHPPVTDHHLAGVTDPDPRVIGRILRGLGRVERPVLFEIVAALLDHPRWRDTTFRRLLVFILEDYRMRGPDDPAREPRARLLLRLCRDPDPAVRDAARRAARALEGVDLPDGALETLEAEDGAREEPESGERREVAFEVLEASFDPWHLPSSWAMLSLLVRNTGATPWPASSAPETVWFQPVIRTAEGVEVPLEPRPGPGFVPQETPPGKVRRLRLPLRTPSERGRYRLGVRPIRGRPGEPPWSTGAETSLEVEFRVTSRIL